MAQRELFVHGADEAGHPSAGILRMIRHSPATQEPSASQLAPPEEVGPVLRPQLDPRWALSPRGFLAVALLCTLFVLATHVPLRSTDLWSHVAYGQWILQHQRLPAEDPFLPQYAGMPVVDTAWGSQVLLAAAYRLGREEGLSLVYAATLLAAFAFFLRAAHLLTGSLGAGIASLLLAVGVGWSRLLTIRPENFGLLAFAALLWMLARNEQAPRDKAEPEKDAYPDVARWMWPAVPGLMVLWANLHGSFVCGLVLLGAYTLGALVAACRQHGARRCLRDGRFHRWLLLSELALAATVVNPYGIGLLVHTLQFAGNPNLKDIIEWHPLVLASSPGPEFVFSLLVLLVWWRWSRRPLHPGHIAAWAIFALLTALTMRMVIWYALVFAYASAPHLLWLYQAWRKQRDAEASEAPASQEPVSPWRWGWTLAAGLFVWSAFILSPASSPLLGARKRTPYQIYHRMTTPYRVTQFLHRAKLRGLVYTPQHWGDWLLVHGPQGMRPWITSNIHLIPPRLWQDYVQVWQVHAGWERTLQRHRIETAIVDKNMQRQLYQAMQNSRSWQPVYDGPDGAVFRWVDPNRSPESQQPGRSTPKHDTTSRQEKNR